MQRCLQLAAKGLADVSPNPMVGAVLVHEDQIIGEGYHQQFGGPHAEVNCINSVQEQHQGLIAASTLYVSLEPCSHVGKTPPCANLILEKGIRKVVVACRDISDKVNGKGIELLKASSVEVIEGVLEEEAQKMNQRFFTFHTYKRPFIILKWAKSIEGFIGSLNERIKLSSNETDKLVHRWRSEEDAIWVGYSTAKIDNPQLNVRHIEGKNPIRIIYDKDLSLNSSLYLFDGNQATMYFNTHQHKIENKLEYIKIEHSNYIEQILHHLHERQVMSVIVEGGAKLIQQFLDKNLWDEIRMIQTNTSLDKGIASPQIQHNHPFMILPVGTDHIHYYKNEF